MRDNLIALDVEVVLMSTTCGQCLQSSLKNVCVVRTTNKGNHDLRLVHIIQQLRHLRTIELSKVQKPTTFRKCYQMAGYIMYGFTLLVC